MNKKKEIFTSLSPMSEAINRILMGDQRSQEEILKDISKERRIKQIIAESGAKSIKEILNSEPDFFSNDG